LLTKEEAENPQEVARKASIIAALSLAYQKEISLFWKEICKGDIDITTICKMNDLLEHFRADRVSLSEFLTNNLNLTTNGFIYRENHIINPAQEIANRALKLYAQLYKGAPITNEELAALTPTGIEPRETKETKEKQAVNE